MGATSVFPVLATLATGGLAGIYYGTKNEMEKKKEGVTNAIKDEQNAINKEVSDQNTREQTNLNQQQMQAGASQKSALAAIRAAMSASTSSGGTILSGPQGAQPAVAPGKQLLGI